MCPVSLRLKSINVFFGVLSIFYFTFKSKASGTQLIATYPNGDDLSCGTIGLVMYLKCNKSAVWAKPINGQPNAIPTEVTVELDSKPGGCLVSSTNCSSFLLQLSSFL